MTRKQSILSLKCISSIYKHTLKKFQFLITSYLDEKEKFRRYYAMHSLV